MEKIISKEIEVQVAFYDVDSMNVAWHGHYARYLEEARCALLDELGYNYNDMRQSGYSWPVVVMKIKYIKPCIFKQKIKVKATLVEFENCIKIKYLITDTLSGEKISKAETMQMAVDLKTFESCLESPKTLICKVRNYQNA